ncbi:MAG: Helix-turn-helix domain [Eubacterium sp.]|nr:Helix-turn-helix domain [Eubacterium sp.]
MEKTIGERLKQLVREKGMEQQEAAVQLNIKIPTFNGYVSNKREPSISKLKQLAAYFNVSDLPEEARSFILDSANKTYIELAMDIKERTITAAIKHNKEMKR